MNMPILVPVSWGEILDKITILDIKSRRIQDEAKLANVARERTALDAVAKTAEMPAEAAAVYAKLMAVNEALWDIEDEIRDCERHKAFGERFIELARSVYHRNDERALLKRQLNEILGSELVEEKSYQAY